MASEGEELGKAKKQYFKSVESEVFLLISMFLLSSMGHSLAILVDNLSGESI